MYNRAAHGVQIFTDDGGGNEFVEILSTIMRLDGHTVFAWALCGNHYHVVLRSSAVSLARTFGRIQSGFGRWRNRSLRTRGPTWQSRYKAKLVEDESYLMRLIAYVHLNPVTAGMCNDPAEHQLSGHRELLDLSDFGVIARDEVLLLYGDTVRAAQSSYVSTIGAFLESEDWLVAKPGRLPWWRHEPDCALRTSETAPVVAMDGRPFRAVRPKLEAEEYLEAACEVLAINGADLVSKSRRREISWGRFTVVGLGIERWGQSAKAPAALFERHPEFVSWWAKRAAELRMLESDFAAAYEDLDERLRSRFR